MNQLALHEVLFDAVKKNDAPALLEAISLAGNVNLMVRKGKTLLWVAVKRNHRAVAEVLLKDGRADPLVRGEQPIDPIDLAARMRHLDLLGLLLFYTSRATAERKLRRLEGVLPDSDLEPLRAALGEDLQYRLPELKAPLKDLLRQGQLQEGLAALLTRIDTLNFAVSAKHSPLTLALKYGKDSDYDWLTWQGASPDYIADMTSKLSPGDLRAQKSSAPVEAPAVEPVEAMPIP